MQTLHIMHCGGVRANPGFAFHALLWCEGQFGLALHACYCGGGANADFALHALL
jgi:hypothetical protein